MKRVLFLGAFATLTALVATNGWAAATYIFSSNDYSSITNFSSCGTGPCATYTALMSLTGSFTLASALPPNFSGGADITSQVTAYSFSDGVNTYASTDPNSRIYQFAVVTDSSGNITIGGILLELWQSGVSPHAVGNRVALLNLNGPSINQAQNNLTCTAVTNGGTASGVADVCQFANTDASSSTASATLGSFTSATPVFQSAVSRKLHGAAGTFDLSLSTADIHNPTTEPRQGPAQSIVFTFDRPVNAANVTVTEGTATAGVPTFSGNDVVVGLTGVSDQQYVTVSLTNVASSDGSTDGSGSVRVGYLVGDVNQTRVVSIADLGLVNAQLAQLVTAANFLKDVNASGTLTLADKGITNANLTKALPTP